MGRIALCLLLGLAACGERSKKAAKKAAEEITRPIQGHARLLEAVNGFRKERGLDWLHMDEILIRTANGHAEEMARLGYFGHFSPVPDRRTPDDRLAREGWPEARKGHEFIARAPDAETAFRGWLAKPDLKERLADADVKAAGIGRSDDYWVLIVGG